MEVGFSGAAANPDLDLDLLIQGMVDEQNGLNANNKEKIQRIIDGQKILLHFYMHVYHPDMEAAIDNPPENCEFLTRGLEDFATQILELADHEKSIMEFIKQWDVGASKMYHWAKLSKEQADSAGADREVISLKEEKVMLEEIRIVVGEVNKKLLDIEKDILKFTLICEKEVAVKERTFDENGNPREVDNSLPGALRRSLIFANSYTYREYMRRLKEAYPPMQVYKRCTIWPKLVDFLIEDLEQPEHVCNEEDFDGDENQPAKKMCICHRFSKLMEELENMPKPQLPAD